MSLTEYPEAIDNFVQPQTTDTMDGSIGSPAVDHTLQHQQLNAAVEAIETVIGVLGDYNFSTTVVGQIRPPVKVAAWSNTDVTSSPPSGAATVDGYAVQTGDRVLLTNQATTHDGGIWVANRTGHWTRPSDWATGSTIGDGTLIAVGGEGAFNFGQLITTVNSTVVGTGAPSFSTTVTPEMFDFSLTDTGPNGYVDLTVAQLNVQALSFGAAVHSNPSNLFQYPGNPNTHVSALVIGDLCVDITTPAVWQATAADNAHWQQLAPSGSGVTSFNTRTGAVVPTTGDYTASEVGALPSTDDLSAISSANATAGNVSMNSHKITGLANGSASSDAAAFGQIPTALPPNGTAGGDLSGTFPNPTVAKLNGVAAASYALLASPALTGTPTAPTAAGGTNTTQIATTAFVTSAVSVTPTNTVTLTNKRVTRRVQVTNAPGATPSIDTDNYDVARFTGLATAITSMSTNLTGTPNDGDSLIIMFTDAGTAEAITWGASFEASTVALPTTTVASALLTVGFLWNVVTSKWRCVAVA